MIAFPGDVDKCIGLCSDCARICTETVMYCLEQGGEHTSPTHIRLMLDCAAVCQLTADLMLRDSDFATQIAATCGVIAQQCAEDCARFTDDAQMQRRADACRAAAQACYGMSGRMRNAA